MSYSLLWAVHVSCVVLSISLFTLRGAMLLADVDWRRWRVLRIAPHIVDSVLLLAALGLAFYFRQYPFQDTWLTAKFVALLAYIALGKFALQPRLSPGRRGLALIIAVFTVTYIVGVAITHSASWALA